MHSALVPQFGTAGIHKTSKTASAASMIAPPAVPIVNRLVRCGWPLMIHFRRSGPLPQTPMMGGLPTFAEAIVYGEVAPSADLPAFAAEREGSTPERPFAPDFCAGQHGFHIGQRLVRSSRDWQRAVSVRGTALVFPGVFE
jgi:hypothetical protein